MVFQILSTRFKIRINWHIQEYFQNLSLSDARYKRIYLHSPENLRRLFLKNVYLIRNWKGERLKVFPQMYKYRKSMEELRQTEEECRYICDMKIESIEQVEEQLNYVEYKIKYLKKLRYSIIDNSGIEVMEDTEREEKLSEITNNFSRFMKEKKNTEWNQK